jgi:cell wall-associated NlpC family hydrolase
MSWKAAFGLLLFLLSLDLSGCAARRPPDFSSLGRAEPPATPVQEKVLNTARSLLGTPYLYGGTTPKGFDCTGYINYVYRHSVGMGLPRQSHDLARAGRAVAPEELRPADIVYFKIERQKPLHMGIYLGRGKFIHAPSTNGKVNVQSLTVDYWRDRYLGARRLL